MKHTQTSYEILIYNNGGDKTSSEYIDSLTHKSIRSSFNNGVCKAYNELAKIARGKYLLLWDDDKLVLPSWDISLLPLIETEGDFAWKSLVEIWPHNTNPCSISLNFGKSPIELQEAKLLATVRSLTFPKKVSLSVSQIMTKKLFDAINGYDEKFYPGFGSDPDIMWRSFCYLDKNPKRFLNATQSFYYHFTSSTTNRIFRYKLITNILRAYGHCLFFAEHGFLPRPLRQKTGYGLLATDLS